MKKNSSFCIVFIAILFSCQSNEKLNKEVITEIETLITNTQKQIFLEKVYNEDQKVRNDRAALEQKYGYDSDKVQVAKFEIMKTDKLRLKMIELYLDKYGHPTIANHGELATRAPYIVIHHSGTIKSRRENFKFLYNAYKNGDLNEGSFSFYLGRFYKMQFGKRYRLPNPYREKQMIDSLMNKLDLLR